MDYILKLLSTAVRQAVAIPVMIFAPARQGALIYKEDLIDRRNG
jgi:hypothetical protein